MPLAVPERAHQPRAPREDVARVEQRQDVARELDRVVLDFKFKMRSAGMRDDEAPPVEWLLYALDHKALAQYVFSETRPVSDVSDFNT